MAGARGRRGALREFFEAYARVAAKVEPLIVARGEPPDRGLSVQRLFHRLLVADLYARRGWAGPVAGRGGVAALWDEYRRSSAPEDSFFRERLDPLWADGELTTVPDEAIQTFVDGLFRRFRFAAREDGQDEPEDALGPELVARLFEQGIAGRHEKGSYYTPGPVVVFMVRQALRAYLEAALPKESRPVIGRLVEERDPRGLRDRAAVLEALHRVRVCDPACGGGAFLEGALQELLELTGLLEGHEGQGPPSPYHRAVEILRNNLFGVDLDEAAVEIARLRLWLAMAADPSATEPPVLPDLRLEAGDSLQGFEWAARFPRVFAEGGFDLVLMNPPYLLSNRVPCHAREWFRRYAGELRSRYGFSSDLYVYFLYRALQLLKPGGILSAITSASFLTNSTKEQLRRDLLDHSPRLVAPAGSEMFDARVYPAIIVAQKGGMGAIGSEEVSFLDLRRVPQEEILEPRLVERLAARVPLSDYRRAFGAVFFEPTDENRRIFRDLLAAPNDARFVRLGEVAPALDTGIHSGNVRDRLFFRNPIPGKPLHRLLQGIQVVRYGVWWDNPEARYQYVDLTYRPDPNQKGIGRGGNPSARGEYWHLCGPMENHHVVERLLMRQTQDEPFVGYIRQGDERVYTDNTLHTLLLNDRGHRLGFSYPYLLAILNSEPLSRIYRAIAQEEGRRLAQVKTAAVNRLPLPVPEGSEAEDLEGLVAEIQGIYRAVGFPLPEEAAKQVAGLQRAIDRQAKQLYGL